MHTYTSPGVDAAARAEWFPAGAALDHLHLHAGGTVTRLRESGASGGGVVVTAQVVVLEKRRRRRKCRATQVSGFSWPEY